MRFLKNQNYNAIEASVKLGHKTLGTLLRRSSLCLLPGVQLFYNFFLKISAKVLTKKRDTCAPQGSPMVLSLFF